MLNTPSVAISFLLVVERSQPAANSLSKSAAATKKPTWYISSRKIYENLPECSQIFIDRIFTFAKCYTATKLQNNTDKYK